LPRLAIRWKFCLPAQIGHVPLAGNAVGQQKNPSFRPRFRQLASASCATRAIRSGQGRLQRADPWGLEARRLSATAGGYAVWLRATVVDIASKQTPESGATVSDIMSKRTPKAGQRLNRLDIMSKRTPATFKQHHYEGDAHHSQDRERKTGADGVAGVGGIETDDTSVPNSVGQGVTSPLSKQSD
jgi:hypothetical protein